jgi:hypothetical protein
MGVKVRDVSPHMEEKGSESILRRGLIKLFLKLSYRVHT